MQRYDKQLENRERGLPKAYRRDPKGTFDCCGWCGFADYRYSAF